MHQTIRKTILTRLRKRFTNPENLSECPLVADQTMPKVSGALTWCRRCVSGVWYLEASLFFSLRDRARATAGRSLTGPMPSMAALSFCSCSPMLWSFWGFGVRSLASVFRALRRPFLPEQMDKLRFSIRSGSTSLNRNSVSRPKCVLCSQTLFRSN